MVRQRWSEAGLFRRLSVVLLCAQAVLIVGAIVVFTTSLESSAEFSLLVHLIVTGSFCLIPVILLGMTAWAVLFGSLRGRVFATVLSAAAFMFWLTAGVWVGVAIAVVAVATILVVWRHDAVEGAVGVRPARPLQ